MTQEWTSSRDLALDLDGAGGRRAGLERGLRDAVRTGRLRAGEQLPSTRALARDLGLARGTVVEAYAQLVAEGFLESRQGAPTRVAATAAAAPPTRAPAEPASRPRADLRPGEPDTSAFPRQAWLRALRRTLNGAPDAALGIGDPRGRPELRAVLAAYLGRARGVIADPEAVVICGGYAQGLTLMARVLRDRGARAIAMEDPGLVMHRDVVEAAGLPVVPLEVDARGAVAEVPSAAGGAVVTPAHQFPLGATLAPERRAGLVEWARASGGFLLEDDYDGEFRYDRQPVGALQGLDPERVIYAGTASKALAPGVRLAWLVLPRELVAPVARAKFLADGFTATLDQLALAELIEAGALDRHLRAMRLRYRRRRDRLLALLRNRAPWGRVLGIAAGLHLVLALPDGAPSEATILGCAREHGLALAGLGPYWHGDGPRHGGLVLGYARPPEHAFGATLAALGDVLALAERRAS